MAGNAVPVRQEGLQKLPLGLAEEGQVGARFPAAEDGSQGDYHDVVQRMALRIPRSGSRQGPQFLSRNPHHHSLSSQLSSKPLLPSPHHCSNTS